ncbi:hypothetical protein [Burkholderia cenocepacia]|uniref:hypothetical protein n=1 Tax=Burkholderia cenocepacia TaxID=95486 RepID=UPI0012B86634|nr:hypothetical protein [Burkholderia cenocepacia]MDI9700370.1 hypothetical protein [Burkholderia cenocepacia]
MTNYLILVFFFVITGLMAFVMLALTERAVNFVRASKIWGAYIRTVYGINIEEVKREKIFRIIRFNGFIALFMSLILAWGVISKFFEK